MVIVPAIEQIVSIQFKVVETRACRFAGEIWMVDDFGTGSFWGLLIKHAQKTKGDHEDDGHIQMLILGMFEKQKNL